jgi:uncharacterized cupin superfamily protein
MVPEAPLERDDVGLYPAGDGWYVINARDLRWFESELGLYAMFDSQEARFDQVGVNLGILRPGEPNCMYHGEDAQEDFLVLRGDCALVVEGQERALKQWDFVHCPPWTEHTIVGAGDGACVILAVGTRGGEGIRFSANEAAAKHGGSSDRDTTDGGEAYARFPSGYQTRYREGLLPA